MEQPIAIPATAPLGRRCLTDLSVFEVPGVAEMVELLGLGVLEVLVLVELAEPLVVEPREALVEVAGVTEAEGLVCPPLETDAAKLVDELVNGDTGLRAEVDESVTEIETLVCPMLEADTVESVDAGLNEVLMVEMPGVGLPPFCGPGFLGKAASAIARGKIVNEKSDIQREVFIASLSK